MAITVNTLVSGYNLDPEFAGYASKLMQAIQRAIPESTFGMILVDNAPPDISGSFAWRTRCLWVDTTNTAAPVLKAYRTGGSPGWFAVADAISNSTITTAMIQAGAVTLAKLSVTGGTPNQLIRVNASGNGFEFVTVANVIAGFGTIPIASLDNTDVAFDDTKFLGTLGGAAGQNYWYTANLIAQQFTDAAIAPSNIAPATVNSSKTKFLSSKTGDTYGVYRVLDADTDIDDGAIHGDKLLDGSVVGGKLSNASVAIGKLSAGTNGYIPSVVAGSVVWVAPSALVGTTTKFVTLVADVVALPTEVATPKILPHTLGFMPTTYRVVLYCAVTNLGYAVGDEVDAMNVIRANGFDDDDTVTAFTFIPTTSSITVVMNYTPWSIYIPSKAVGKAYAYITDANWRLRLYATYTA